MKKLFTILFIFLQTALLSGQDIKIQASVSAATIGLNEQFTYSLEISGNAASLPDAELPEFNDFIVLSGPNSSTSIQIINGSMSSTNTNTFYLQATKEGTFTLPPAVVRYKGKVYKSNSISIKVVKSSSGSAAGKAASRPTQSSASDSEISGQDVYVKTIVSKRKPFLGEQITVAYKLYFRADVRGYDFKKQPSFPGFWKEDFKMPRQPVMRREVVNGIAYNTAILKKYALFPAQVGRLTLEPVQFLLNVVVKTRSRRRSLFDSFFDDPFGRTVQKVIPTKRVGITVEPLPQAGKPKNFSGAVGRFKYTLDVDKTNTNANEAVSLKLKIKGAGNIKMAELPGVSIPPDIEQYEPKVSFKITKENGIVRGEKNAEIILVPRIAGTFAIKPRPFSYFDPIAKKYKTSGTQSIVLHVKKGAVVSTSQKSGLSQKEVDLLGKDIHYIKESGELEPVSYKPYRSLYFWGSVLGMLLLFVAFILYDDQQARILGDERLVRSKRAGRLASKQLSLARRHLGDAEKGAFYKAVSLALRGFVQDKLNIELTEFSAANVSRKLSARGIPAEDIERYSALLEESDFKQFAGAESSAEERKELYERAKGVLTRLEKWI